MVASLKVRMLEGLSAMERLKQAVPFEEDMLRSVFERRL
jgi:hypothetical protein